MRIRGRAFYDPFLLTSSSGMRTRHDDPVLLAIVRAWVAEHDIGRVGTLRAIVTARKNTILLFAPHREVVVDQRDLLEYIAANKYRFPRPRVRRTYPAKPFPPKDYWTLWYGGTFPYEPNLVVKVIYRGDMPQRVGPAGSFDFDWYVGEERPEDIMSFHVEEVPA